MRAFEHRFTPPVITSQFAICPIPFHVDTYRGCVHDCAYCFGRDITNFHRRRREADFAADITLNDAEAFKRWMARNYGRRDDPSKAARVALNMRLPIKVGALSDPCPPIEPRHRVTEAFLRVLALYDYPVQIQTKNPWMLGSILERLGPGLNIVVSVTVISLDAGWCRKVERKAPSPLARVKGIQRVARAGYPVMVKVQPAIYPMILEQLPRIVPAVKDAGAWAFNTEGLKIRVSMPRYEQEIWRETLGGVRDDYKERFGEIESSDFVLQKSFKREYMTMADQLSREHGIAWYSADNQPLGFGAGPECCGTEKLRDYTPFQQDLRSRAFGICDPDDRLARCLRNFGRAVAGKKEHATIGETVNMMAEEFGAE